MIIPDKKKAATIILQRLSAGGDTTRTEVQNEKPMEEDRYHMMAHDFLHGLESKSPAALAEVFRALKAQPGESK